MAVKKLPCGVCGSRDNLAVWDNGAYKCYTPDCTNRGSEFGGSFDEPSSFTPKPTSKLEMTGIIRDIPGRRISLETASKYGVTCAVNERGEISTISYPYPNLKTNELTSAKKRTVATKDFRWSGDRTDTGLFGQNVCRGRGKFITITEGEQDALAVAEMFDCKWDVVSLKDGSGNAARDIKDNLEFLEGYDKIVLCFDMDAAGQIAVDNVKDLFAPQKLKIVKLPQKFKDAAEMLEAKAISAFTKAWWDAKPYSPAGLVNPTDTWSSVLDYYHTPSVAYPWEGLNNLLMGQRKQEIVIWAAETGVGKSQTMREIIYHNMQNIDGKVGCLMLEESVSKSMLGWMSFYAGRSLHKERGLTDEELRGYWEQASHGDRFVLLDHKGWGNDIEQLKSRIRYMAKSLGCEFIILDHLHIALSSVAGASGDWAGIDELVTQLTVLAQECDVCIHLVSHVSEGRALRGSKGISKLADGLIFLERDKHHEDPMVANTTTVVVDKNRWCGDVGTACYLYYDKQTGRMIETSKPVEDDTGEF